MRPEWRFTGSSLTGRQRERLGVTLQTAGLSDVMTVAEMVTLQSGYYSDPRPLREALALARLEDWPSAAAALCRAARRGRCDPRSRSAIELADCAPRRLRRRHRPQLCEELGRAGLRQRLSGAGGSLGIVPEAPRIRLVATVPA